jgi:aminoglycoside phosphotransferase
MRLISRTKGGMTVNNALGDVLKELNDELKRVDWLITTINCGLHTGPAVLQYLFL